MTTAPEDIFGPFLVMQLLTVSVWLCMFSRRIPFLTAYEEKNKGYKPEDLANPSSRHYLVNTSPAHVRNPSDNLKNLFEVPVLFYGMVFYLYSTGNVDATYVRSAWIFAICRCMHSFVHCTFNHVMLRFAVYAGAALALFYMVGRASVAHFL